MNQDAVYLTQTDTTVGFVSHNPLALSLAKHRDPTQPLLICVDSFKKQKLLTRTPKQFRKQLRRTKKTTFIYKNKKAIRIVTQTAHARFLKRFSFVYSSSANENKKDYDLSYAINHADIIVEDHHGFSQNIASSIFHLHKNKIDKLR